MVHKSPYPGVDIPYCNILSFLFPSDKALSSTPQWINAATPHMSLSQAEMLLWVQRFALGLANLGVQENKAVMVFTPNHLFVPVAYLGAVGSKRYFTGANPAYTVDELSYQMSLVEAAVLFIHPSLFDIGFSAAAKASIPIARTFLFSDTDCAEQKGVQDWKSMLASEKEAHGWFWDDLGRDAVHQIATINFSSGTTGLPKGVCTSHYNLIANTAQTISAKFGATEDYGIKRPESWLAFLPLYHAFSQLFTINIACYLRVPVYIMNRFSLADFLDHVQRYKITTIQAVPPVMAMLAKRQEANDYDLTSLRNIMVGAAPMSVQLQNEMTKRFGLFISRGWGMTETTCVGTVLPDDSINTDGSVGYLLPNTEAMIVDEDGNEVLHGPGELYVRGPQMMLGYWKNERSTQDTFATEGWLRTGDSVIVRDDLWWVVDRKKELIKVNGLQVAPAELEAILVQHEGIADAAVVGLVADGNEYPRAYVVPHRKDDARQLGEAEIQEYVAGKVAKHKRLTGGVVFTQTIPRLLSGKIMRSVIKEWAKQDANGVNGRHSRL